MDKPLLRAKIRTAFAHLPYPGDDFIGSENGRDDSEAVSEAFRGLDWRSLDGGRLWPMALYWMTPQAYRFYLPAYLLAALEDDSEDVPVFLIHRLTPPVSSERGEVERFSERNGALTLPQREAVRDFLTLSVEDLETFEREVGGGDSNELSRLRATRDYWERLCGPDMEDRIRSGLGPQSIMPRP